MNGYRPGTLHHVVPAILYIVTVFYLGTSAIDPLDEVRFEFKDKLGHLIVFGGMQLVLARAMAFFRPELPVGRVALRAGATAALLGLLLELWQAALPHRSAELLDFVADSLGAALAGLCWWRLRLRALLET